MAAKTCDRTVTHRNFDYGRVRTIIEEEEYLEDEDYDETRFFRRHGNILKGLEEAKEKYDNLDKYDEFLSSFERHHHRQKRTLIIGTVSNLTKSWMCFDETYTVGTAATVGTTTSWSCIMVKIILIFTAACAATGCFSLPELPEEHPEVPQCPGDPNCPRTPRILDMVHPGLKPIHEFPPFKNPFRTVDAEAVIWREPACTLPGDQLPDDGRGGIPFRKKRDISYCPKKSFLDRLLLNIQCYKPRLEAKLGTKKHGCENGGSYGKKKRDTANYGYNHVNYDYHDLQDTCPGNCGTIEDCFDLPCPRYGARVKYTYTIPRNAQIGQNYPQLTEKQTGEGFRSRAPPDCRTVAG